MKQALRMIVALDVHWGNGQDLTLQPAEDVLFEILIPVRQHRLGQAQPFARRIRGIDAPARSEFRLGQRVFIACDRQLIPDAALRTRGAVAVSTNLTFGHFALVVIRKKALDAILLFNLLDGGQQLDFAGDLPSAAPPRGVKARNACSALSIRR